MRVPLIVPPLAVSVAVSVALGATLAGCGAGGGPPGQSPTRSGGLDPTPAARTELAARAAAAKDLVGVAIYTHTPPGGAQAGTPAGAGEGAGDPSSSPAAGGGERTVMVVRAADGSWRVDIPGGALGGTVDVSIAATADGLFHCTLATPPERGGCVPVDELTAEVDPRLQHVFTDWLDVLTDRTAALAVAHVPVLDGMGGTGGRCFAVQPTSASLLAPLDGGVYCYQPDGTLTGAQLGLGDLTLVSADPAAPPSVALPGPVVAGGEPLPTATPTPSPTRSPAATSTASGNRSG
ncbi:MAG: hypothetical protein GEV12_10140 [Micromonosporaceae bacterium]|nr:hypothetical protein [Micromonosporaceae bacterium]